MTVKCIGSDQLEDLAGPELLFILELRHLQTQKEEAGNPDSQVLEVIFGQGSSVASQIHSPLCVFLGSILPSLVYHLPKVPPIDSTIRCHNQQAHSWHRVSISGFDLAFRNSFALNLFDVLGLVFYYQIQLGRCAIAALSMVFWETTIMQIITAA